MDAESNTDFNTLGVLGAVCVLLDVRVTLYSKQDIWLQREIYLRVYSSSVLTDRQVRHGHEKHSKYSKRIMSISPFFATGNLYSQLKAQNFSVSSDTFTLTDGSTTFAKVQDTDSDKIKWATTNSASFLDTVLVTGDCQLSTDVISLQYYWPVTNQTDLAVFNNVTLNTTQTDTQVNDLLLKLGNENLYNSTIEIYHAVGINGLFTGTFGSQNTLSYFNGSYTLSNVAINGSILNYMWYDLNPFVNNVFTGIKQFSVSQDSNYNHLKISAAKSAINIKFSDHFKTQNMSVSITSSGAVSFQGVSGFILSTYYVSTGSTNWRLIFGVAIAVLAVAVVVALILYRKKA
ncbi:hypothetical protein HDV01_007485 [Terramyces sp. JEL0728]|nr:hypothetical protein HDV01_007485 [Terramyces sp. JEL0728]